MTPRSIRILTFPFLRDNPRLESSELVPFAAAIASGTQLIMTAHIFLPQIDSENPASLSRLMLSQQLRRKMKFDGIILADDLGMGAIAKRYGAGEFVSKNHSSRNRRRDVVP